MTGIAIVIAAFHKTRNSLEDTDHRERDKTRYFSCWPSIAKCSASE